MTDPTNSPGTFGPATKVKRPTMLTQRTIAGISAAILVLILLIICIMGWGHWDIKFDDLRIGSLTRIALGLGLILLLIVISWMLPTNGSEEFTGPGISFKINGDEEKANA